MIVLTIRSLKDKKDIIEAYGSMDNAKKRLEKLITDPKYLEKNPHEKKGYYLVGYSVDTKAEKELVRVFLPESRRMSSVGVDLHGGKE